MLDESYSLSITQEYAQLTAKTVWGALHGLQTFAQLVVHHNGNYSIPYVPIQITDEPRFPWRGLLVDTARHFMEVSTLKRQIEALAAVKMNVFHWHVVDAESFPMESASEPLLVKGAYAPSAHYSKADVQEIIAFAKARGVRTVVEFDVPGHAASWGVGMPDITAKCPAYSHNINNIPLRPFDNALAVMSNLFAEMTALFPDNWFHTGGDEVVTGCFSNDPEVATWMRNHGMSSGAQVYAFFEQKISSIIKGLHKKHLVWEDVFNAGIHIDPTEVMVEVWSNHDTLAAVTAQGIKVRENDYSSS